MNIEEAKKQITYTVTSYLTKSEYGESHDGLKGITEYIYKNHISIHIHGHIHGESEEILKNGTKCICLYKVKLLEL